MPRKARISLTIDAEILEKIDNFMEQENRNRSNCAEQIFNDFFGGKKKGGGNNSW